MRSSQPETATGGDQASAAGDGDGRREQMGERFAEMRKKFDADGDGQLNDAERATMRHESLMNRMKQMDTDGDGKLSRQEMEANPLGGRMLRDFDGMDRDRDSFVTPAEMEAAMAERRARWNERRQQRSGDQADQPGAPAQSPADL